VNVLLERMYRAVEVASLHVFDRPPRCHFAHVLSKFECTIVEHLVSDGQEGEPVVLG